MQTLSAVLVVLSLTAAAPAQVRYTVTDLGTLDGFHAHATAISESGWIVGFANTPDSGYDLAVVWRGPGIAGPIAITGEGVSGAFAHGVNEAGLVVGLSDSLGLTAFSLDGGSGLGRASAVGLGTLGGFVSEASGVNSSGLIVGSAMTVSGFNHAVKWARPGAGHPYVMTPLPELGGFGSAARAVSDSGVIVGTADTELQVGVPCVWPVEGGVVPLGVDQAWFGEALAVNDTGHVAGYAYTRTGTVAFVWSAEAGMVDIGNLGNHHAVARGINNRGEVVGQSFIPGTSAAQHAFVWRAGVLTDLETAIAPDSGWSLWDASAITEDGRIVGAGVLNGRPRAFLLTPIACPGDLGSVGGVRGPDGALDNNDFVAFIDAFFASDPLADRGSTGGAAGGDGTFDNNDFVVFVDQFFAGC